MDRETFLRKFSEFFDSLSRQIKAKKILFDKNWHVDHVCYRVESEDRYQELKSSFSEDSNLLVESMVNGRLISTFKLFEPVFFDDYQIDLVELPAPKFSKPTTEGFEHIEVVIDKEFDEIVRTFPEEKFSRHGLEKDFNKELVLNLDNCSIKFHQLSLESVVNLETNKPVFKALVDSEILTKLKKFSPLIAGTYPLSISTESSDIDILLSSESLDEVEKIVKEEFSKNENFFSTFGNNDEGNYYQVNFNFSGQDFELFASQTPSVKQRAYRHFQIEERLLKVGGSVFHDKIMKLRAKGIKTEPAFVEVLGIKGDPYRELLDLQRLSESELRSLTH